MKQSKQLIEFCRQNRQGVPPEGDILTRPVLREVLTMLLDAHLARTKPQEELVYQVPRGGGNAVFAPKPAPEWRPQTADATAKELATLISLVEDL